MDYELLLVGNPNVGKTSVYNRITRSFEHVGNWHGVTVEEKNKSIIYKDKALVITDLPGLYSLSPYSPEEKISVERIIKSRKSVVINVIDVNNIARNLYLTLQLIEAEKKVVLAVNMVDELTARGERINANLLANRLKMPVVATSAKYGKSAFDVLDPALESILSDNRKMRRLDYLDGLPIDEIAEIIAQNAENAQIPVRWAAIKVIEKDLSVIDMLALNERQREALEKFGDNYEKLVKARYDFIDAVCAGIVEKDKAEKKKKTALIGKIDKIALNKYLALPVFVLVMMAVFLITFGLVGKRCSDFLAWASDKYIYTWASEALAQTPCPDWIVALICDGIIKGVFGVIVFLPQIVLLFFFLALMEDSGYVSRVAFMTDGMFGKIGLSGRSVFTLIMGFGCTATAVMTSRGLEDENMRKKTAIITPFMSCTARLPVYVTIGGAFFSGGNWAIIFFLYMLGIGVALSAAAIMEKHIKNLKSGRPTFIMEMPPYRLPTVERVLQILWNNVKVFLIKVGTTIFLLNIIVWILSNFSFADGFLGQGDSIMETLSKSVAWMFKPLGFGSWQAVTALLSGFVAKEAVVSTIESMGGVQMLFNGETAAVDALAFMCYTLLYVPCVASIAALIKEVGWKWTAVGVVLQLLVAYAIAFIVRQIGLMILSNVGLSLGIAIVFSASAIPVFVSIKAKSKKCSLDNCGDCAAACKKWKC